MGSKHVDPELNCVKGLERASSSAPERVERSWIVDIKRLDRDVVGEKSRLWISCCGGESCLIGGVGEKVVV